jgi:hypothetical protein
VLLQDGWADAGNDAMQEYSQQFPFRIRLWVPKVRMNVVVELTG